MKKIIYYLIMIVLIFLVLLSGYKILIWKKENIETEVITEKIEEQVIVNEVEDTEKTEIIEQEEVIDEFNPYWDYIKMNLLDVNINELKNTNNDVAGWIRVMGTNINYPFVQTTDNSYYLTHSFDKSYNSAGWIFLDYRNNKEEFDKNTIIYGHGRYDESMFGSLKNILTSGWTNYPSYFVVKLSTLTENTLWQVFSVYKIPTTSDYLQITFSTDDEFNEFTDMLINRSAFDFNTTVSSTDKILTLSTCYNDNEKVVLHAKLIKRENKN